MKAFGMDLGNWAEDAADCAAPRLEQPVKVIAVTGGKGGIGKTILAANLAVALSRGGRKTMLLDADLGLANVDVLLNLQPRFNLGHVMRGEQSLADVVTPGPAGLQVVPSASGSRLMAQLGTAENVGLVRAFSDLTQQLDVMVIDTAAGVGESVGLMCAASRHVLVVVCDDPASITDAYATIKVLYRDHGLEHFLVVVNRVDTVQQGREVFHRLQRVANKFLSVQIELVSVVPQDSQVERAVRQQRPVIEAYPRSRAATAIAKLARKIDALSLPLHPRGDLEFFVERLVRHSTNRAKAV